MSKKNQGVNANTIQKSEATKAQRAYFKNIQTLSDVRSQFLAYVLKTKNAKKSKAFLEQYAKLAAEFNDRHRVYQSDKIFKQPAANSPEAFARMIFELKNLEGLELRMEGRLLWASGETKANREVLKKFGFSYRHRLTQWVWNDVETKNWPAAIIPAA